MSFVKVTNYETIDSLKYYRNQQLLVFAEKVIEPNCEVDVGLPKGF